MSAAQHRPGFGIGIGHPTGSARRRGTREGATGILPIAVFTDFRGTVEDVEQRPQAHHPEQWRFETSKVQPANKKFKEVRARWVSKIQQGRAQRREADYRSEVAWIRGDTRSGESVPEMPVRLRFADNKQETLSVSPAIEVELQKERNRGAMELVTSWLAADQEIGSDTWSLLKTDLEENRLSGRGLWHSDP